MLNKETLEHLAGLARIELDSKEDIKILADLEKILHHFDELKEVDTDNVGPMSGGNLGENVFREGEQDLTKDLAIKEFPESEKGFLKVPPVFSAEGGSASGGE